MYTEILRPQEQALPEDKDESTNAELKNIVLTAIDALSKDDGWTALSILGGYISKNNPSFDPRNYGYSKLGKLIKSLRYLDIDERPFKDDSLNFNIYVRANVAEKKPGNTSKKPEQK